MNFHYLGANAKATFVKLFAGYVDEHPGGDNLAYSTHSKL